MGIEINFEKCPDDDLAGPPTRPPGNVATWLESRLNAAEKEASERNGQVVGFIIDQADIRVPDKDNDGVVITPRDHLFIATRYPEE